MKKNDFLNVQWKRPGFNCLQNVNVEFSKTAGLMPALHSEQTPVGTLLGHQAKLYNGSFLKDLLQ